jgi:hypothetical protein
VARDKATVDFTGHRALVPAPLHGERAAAGEYASGSGLVPDAIRRGLLTPHAQTSGPYYR